MAKTITTGFISATINGIKVNTSIPCHSANYANCASRDVSYIVMHYTGNSKDNAKNNANYFAKSNGNVSAHFFVDDTSIYQSVELKDRAWHCGGTSYYHSICRNKNAFGIEMCCTAGNYTISDKTIENSAYLCAYLCEMLGITSNQVDTYVLRHYDVTHKSCPKQMAGADNAQWNAFKETVKGILNKTNNVITNTTTNVDTNNTYSNWTGYVNTKSDNLNVRSSASSANNKNIIGSLAKGATVTVVGENGSWYEISYNGKTAYVSKTYIGKTKPTTTNNTNTYSSWIGYVNTTSGNLNVRKGAGTDYAIIGKLSKGSTVTIVDESGSWYKVAYNNVIGYVSKQYISNKPTAYVNNVVPSYANWIGYVNTKSDSLNVRSSANSVSKSNIIGTLAKGQSVTVKGESGDWYKIAYNGKTAYVSKTYISKTKPTIIANTSKSYRVKVTAKKGLNIRKSASTLSRKVGSLGYGTTVTISKVSGKWGYITNRGWICLDYTAKA